MRKYLVILVVTFLFILNKNVKAQSEFHLSQYMLHQPFINPASIGSYNNFNGALLYKKQWVNLEGSPEIQAFNINSPFKKNSSSHLGLNIINDKIGVNKNLNIAITYAHVVKFGEKSRLSFGLSAMADILQSNYADVKNLGDVNDPLFSANSETYITPNFNYGMYYYSNKFYVGFVLPKLMVNSIQTDTNLTENSSSEFDINQWHYYLSAGYKFRLNNKWDLTTSTFLKHIEGAPFQVDINAIIEYDKKIGFGVSYRTSKDVVGLLTYQLNTMFKLAYSYDYSFSELAAYQAGTHEISLIFNLINDKKPLHISAPRF